MSISKIKRVQLIAPATEFGAYPPLGLIAIASFIRKEGYEVSVIDYSGEEVNEKRVRKDIEKFNPDIVALGVITGPGISRAMMVSKTAKSLNKYVIWGGPQSTILPQITIDHPDIDAIILGEGEYALIDLIHHLEGKIKEPEGTWIKKDGKTYAFGPQSKFVDLNNRPMPAWELLSSLDKYFPYRKHNVVLMEATRGCAYKCSFCHHANLDVKAYGGVYRNVNAEKVMEQFYYIRSLTKKHIDRMDIGGDLHLITPSYTEQFCKDMLKLKDGTTWQSVSKFHLMNVDLAKLAARAGCEQIMFGVESGSPRLQKFIGKGVNIEHARPITKALRERDVMVTDTYMMGHPHETYEELKMTLKYMKSIPADQNLLQIYRPFPGTPYYDLCVRENLCKAPETLEQCNTFGVLTYHANISDIPTNKLLREFYKTNLIEQTRYLINSQKFYLRNKMYEQFFDNLKHNKFTFKLKELIRVKLKK